MSKKGDAPKRATKKEKRRGNKDFSGKYSTRAIRIKLATQQGQGQQRLPIEK